MSNGPGPWAISQFVREPNPALTTTHTGIRLNLQRCGPAAGTYGSSSLHGLLKNDRSEKPAARRESSLRVSVYGNLKTAGAETRGGVMAQICQLLSGLKLLVTSRGRAVGTIRNGLLIPDVFHGPGPCPGQGLRFGPPTKSLTDCAK